jgi:hypothetical protein
MVRRQRTNRDSRDAPASSLRAAVSDSVWATQDRLVVGLGRVLRSLADVVKWPFERVAFALQERLVWPAEDRAATMSAPARALSFGAVVLLAAGAGVAGLIWAAPDGSHNTVAAPVAATPAPLVAKQAPPEKAAEPTLHGATPVFKPVKEQAASEVDPAKAIVKSTPASSSSSSQSSASKASSATLSSDSAQASSVDGPPAGPAAVSVARDFASAFVLYETGSSDAPVRAAFGKTATPELARALLRRPPRLPANVKVPKAKVVNVVPGPSHGGVYSVSVSLLRVGLTSELRLDMERHKAQEWRVTNVLG